MIGHTNIHHDTRQTEITTFYVEEITGKVHGNFINRIENALLLKNATFCYVVSQDNVVYSCEVVI